MKNFKKTYSTVPVLILIKYAWAQNKKSQKLKNHPTPQHPLFIEICWLVLRGEYRTQNTVNERCEMSFVIDGTCHFCIMYYISRFAFRMYSRIIRMRVFNTLSLHRHFLSLQFGALREKHPDLCSLYEIWSFALYLLYYEEISVSV